MICLWIRVEESEPGDRAPHDGDAPLIEVELFRRGDGELAEGVKEPREEDEDGRTAFPVVIIFVVEINASEGENKAGKGGEGGMDEGRGEGGMQLVAPLKIPVDGVVVVF